MCLMEEPLEPLDKIADSQLPAGVLIRHVWGGVQNLHADKPSPSSDAQSAGEGEAPGGGSDFHGCDKLHRLSFPSPCPGALHPHPLPRNSTGPTHGGRGGCLCGPARPGQVCSHHAPREQYTWVSAGPTRTRRHRLNPVRVLESCPA